jgi:hypothetical protein
MKALLLLLPNLAVLLGRLLRDPSEPRTAKVALGAIAAYLASPVDLIPRLHAIRRLPRRRDPGRAHPGRAS